MKRIKNIIKAVIIFTLSITYTYLMSALFKSLFNINIANMNEIIKVLFSSLFNIIFIFLLILIYHKDLKNDLNDFKENYKSYLSFGLKIWIISVILMIIGNKIIYQYFPYEAANETIAQAYTYKFPIYMIFSSIIYAPFTEELIYRKSIRDIFNNELIEKILYILISGLIFGYVHTTAGTDELEILYIIPYGIVGSAFAYIYTKTKNIYTTIALHATHNLIVISTYFLPLILK